jgi:hypothetical protein
MRFVWSACRTILDSLHLCGLGDLTSTTIYLYEKRSMQNTQLSHLKILAISCYRPVL